MGNTWAAEQRGLSAGCLQGEGLYFRSERLRKRNSGNCDGSAGDQRAGPANRWMYFLRAQLPDAAVCSQRAQKIKNPGLKVLLKMVMFKQDLVCNSGGGDGREQ